MKRVDNISEFTVPGNANSETYCHVVELEYVESDYELMASDYIS